jgi:hypothetical protein
MSSAARTAQLVPYGHPATWPGEQLGQAPLSFEAARTLLCGRSAGPGYVLGIDQARSSGYGVLELERRRVVQHGRCSLGAGQRAVLKALRSLPGFSYASLLVVMEDHRHLPVSKGGSAATLLGIGDARGQWKALLSICEHPPAQMLLVEPREWRRVMGTRVNLQRDAWKAQARMWASAVLQTPVRDDDEAEALGIAYWGAWDGLYKWATHELGGAKKPEAATRARRQQKAGAR